MNSPDGKDLPPLLVGTLAKEAWRDFLRARRGLIVCEVLFKLVQAWVFVPAVAALLAGVLSVAGHVAVSNNDILDFLLTPWGAVYAALVATLGIALLLCEQACLMIIASTGGNLTTRSVPRFLRAAMRTLLRVVQLSAVVIAVLALAWLPLVVIAALTFWWLLTGHDIYYYINERPPVFWQAIAIGAVLLSVGLGIGVWLYVRWALALPIVLFEQQPARAALRTSAERVRGRGWRVGLVLLGWPLAMFLAGAMLQGGMRLLATTTLAHAGERPIAGILLLLVLQAALLMILSFVTVVGQSLLIRRAYLACSEEVRRSISGEAEAIATAEGEISPWCWRVAAFALPVIVVAPLAFWWELSRYLAVRPPVGVTAHRGHSHVAPENTLSAVRAAIDSGADYAEIDVQQTADGVVVLLHDRDMQRVARDSRRIAALTYDEVRQLDVGSWFSTRFADERVPTLKEVIEASRGRIRLNIELKFYGPERGLAGAVARLVKEQQFESECIVTSLQYDALAEVQRHNPRIVTGAIIATALGDTSRLDVGVVSVRADFLSPAMLRSAHRRGQQVHAWTVDDPRQMAQLIKRGVDNLITGNPDRAVQVRNQWADLTESERLLLASRLLLGLEP